MVRMSLYPSQPQTLTYLISRSFKYYGRIFKAIFPLILLIAIVKNAPIYLGGVPAERWIRLIVLFVIALLIVYLWSVALYRAHSIFAAAPVRLKPAFRVVYSKLSLIYAGFFILIIGICLLFFIGYLLSSLAARFFVHDPLVQALVLLLFAGLPITIFLVLFFPVWTLLVTKTLSVWRAFYQSAQWVGYRNWLRMFALYASYIFVFLFVSPATLHGKWLAQHYLSFVFDAIVLSIFTPLLINFTVLLVNDLHLRNQKIT
ncbi:hypothetical protein [Coxiella burnetii]|uniref:Hypothetical membrane spanning protein n=1 Tax=Coxiella burnetii (strain RSA 493 / Nine Mile phase I) TaxID=227377 RepID=Q83DW5_COXBU|nr:hypothetical protein [Coxiella burnetii]NP_819607.2 membrane-spanning protein [Coxiella burnetii RSA 493]AAO90121.2 hypothetical membrane spanning protein [Coxiella burnetii RSA 493]ARI65448.1 hypothetical protein B7L74_03000 [Coxiella burnetii]ARK26928.1 hypothetical protein BMW92_02905 [Coxiella burnetii]ATN74038.1 hypothetical protein AYM90_02875 [Coxiella burnetii]ATN75943.1 hypothetical protein AYM94_02855 [Coxiella burnetii]